jgi:hypothetical protein
MADIPMSAIVASGTQFLPLEEIPMKQVTT